MKALISPDKFKGTLSARDAAEAIARGWRKSRPSDTLSILPMTDGGDGFGEVMSGLFGAKIQTVKTVDAAHRPCRARWWWEPKSRTAMIESAEVIGLAQLPPGRFHPFELDTFGLGAVVQAAAKKGARRCWMGLGGSSTNDGGFGLARALGWEFFDGDGKPITHWTQVHRLAEARATRKIRWFAEWIVAVDAENPLLGPRGCTRVYGPQKGLEKTDFSRAEACLYRLAETLKRQWHRDCASRPGAGAAGGLGFGLAGFFGARLRPGFELFASQVKLNRRLRTAELVITGEGAMDESTFMGKGVGEIARHCAALKVPCLCLTGEAPAPDSWKKYFAGTFALTDLTSLEQAKRKPAYWLERLAEKVARNWQGK